jgi:hypothetical protein
LVAYRLQVTRFPVLYVAFELGNSSWKLACSDERKVRHVSVTARDLNQVERALLRAQNHFALAEGCELYLTKGINKA